VAGQAAASVLDASVIDSLREVERLGRAGLVARLARIYLRDGEELMAAMAAAADREDSEGLRRSAHDLKSASANLGAQRVSELCAELEQRARDGCTAGAGQRVEAIRQAFDEACREVRSLPEIRGSGE